MAYTEFLFDVCQQFGLRYYFAKKERHFVEEVTRVTWANRQEEKTGIRQDIRPLVFCLTHTVTHTGKRADGTHGAKSSKGHTSLE